MPIVWSDTTPSLWPAHRSSQLSGGTCETARRRMRSGCRMPNRFAVIISAGGSGTPVLKMIDSCRCAHAQANGRITLTTTDMTLTQLPRCFFDDEDEAAQQSIR